MFEKNQFFLLRLAYILPLFHLNIFHPSFPSFSLSLLFFFSFNISHSFLSPFINYYLLVTINMSAMMDKLKKQIEMWRVGKYTKRRSYIPEYEPRGNNGNSIRYFLSSINIYNYYCSIHILFYIEYIYIKIVY